MRRVIWYETTDPFYSDQVQTFISDTIEGLDEQQYEFEHWLGREHPAGIMYVYRPRIIFDSECSDIDREVNEWNYKRFKEKRKTNKPKM